MSSIQRKCRLPEFPSTVKGEKEPLTLPLSLFTVAKKRNFTAADAAGVLAHSIRSQVLLHQSVAISSTVCQEVGIVKVADCQSSPAPSLSEGTEGRTVCDPWRTFVSIPHFLFPPLPSSARSIDRRPVSITNPLIVSSMCAPEKRPSGQGSADSSLVLTKLDDVSEGSCE